MESEFVSKNIGLKFHRFNEKFCSGTEGSIFFPLNNKEKDLKNSKFSQLLQIISEEYNNEGNTLKLTYNHRFLLNEIEKKSKELKNEMIKYSSIEKILVRNKNLIETSSELRKYLVDLHKIGSIVYFDDDILRETIITDPIWFNRIFISILNYGRKKICLMIENIFHRINEEFKINPKNFDQNKLTCRTITKNHLAELTKGFPREITMDDIWKGHRKNSIVDKLSFNSLLKKLEEIEKKIEGTHNHHFLNSTKRNFGEINEKIPISQIVHSIEEKTLVYHIVNEILGDDCFNAKKRKFLMDLLVKYDLIVPKGKVVLIDSDKYYLIPFLFSEEKPIKIFLENGQTIMDDINRNEEWKIKYFLPFKTSSMWKVLFLKIRKCCVKDENKQMIFDEYYWKDGFVFDFQDSSKLNFEKNQFTNIKDNTTVVILEIYENKKFSDTNYSPNLLKKTQIDDKTESQVVLEIKIKSNENIDDLFESVDQSVKEFISKWVVGKFYDQIKFSIEKKSIGEKKIVRINEKKNDKIKIICYYCSHNTLANENTLECEICQSKNFLIENIFGILSVVAQGGFGRVFQCIHLKSKTIVAIKERKDENKIDEWKREIFITKLIEKNVPKIIFPRIICVLDEKYTNVTQKFIVLEYVDDGRNMRGFNQKFLKIHSFDQQNHFIEMILSFLFSLKYLHNNKFLHRDIKPGKNKFFLY